MTTDKFSQQAETFPETDASFILCKFNDYKLTMNGAGKLHEM